MFPYHDDNETQRTPYITLIFITFNVLVWLFAQGAGAWHPLARSVCNLGLIAGELTGALPAGTSVPIGKDIVCLTSGPHLVHLVTSMFLHGSWLHLIGTCGSCGFLAITWKMRRGGCASRSSTCSAG
jgi:rhomboid family protein